MTLGRWLFLAAAVPGTAAAQAFAYEGSLGLASGQYIFVERTTSWTLLSGVALTSGPWTVRASLPLYLQNTTLVTTSGGRLMPTGGSMSGQVSDSGAHRGSRSHMTMPASATTGFQSTLGDPLAQVSWRVARGRGLRWSLTLGAAVKAPVTDTSEFGTGAWDAGATLALSQQLGDATLLGLDAAFWHYGDMPDLDFRDAVSGSLSATTLIASRWAAGVSVWAATPALRGYDGPVTAGATLGWLGRRGLWNLSLAFGLTETAPDVAVTAGWRLVL